MHFKIFSGGHGQGLNIYLIPGHGQVTEKVTDKSRTRTRTSHRKGHGQVTDTDMNTDECMVMHKSRVGIRDLSVFMSVSVTCP